MTKTEILAKLSGLIKALHGEQTERFKVLMTTVKSVIEKQASGKRTDEDFENVSLFIKSVEELVNDPAFCNEETELLLSVYEFGVLTIRDLEADMGNTSIAVLGGTARARKYDEVKRFVQERYFRLSESDPNIKLVSAAARIASMIKTELPNCPIVETNLLNCLCSWISQIRKTGKLI